MSELLLTVDTATPAGSIAVTRGEAVLGELLLNVQVKHTDRLLVTIRQLLGDLGLETRDLDAFAAVIGPGAFTGLRVGVATVKGLALATGRPLLGVSSLRTVALQAPYARHPLCALLDARKDEVYAGIYCWEGGLPTPLQPEVVMPPEALLAGLEGEVLFAGDGAVRYRSLIVRHLGARAHFVPWPLDLPRAAMAAALALDDLRAGSTIPQELFAPRYIRLSEAEIAWSRRHQNGLIEG